MQATVTLSDTQWQDIVNILAEAPVSVKVAWPYIQEIQRQVGPQIAGTAATAEAPASIPVPAAIEHTNGKAKPAPRSR